MGAIAHRSGSQARCMNYYNEIDPYCAAWLQNLMDAKRDMTTDEFLTWARLVVRNNGGDK